MDTDARSDAHLAARLAADLDRAFPKLVADHRDRLYTIALRILGDSRDAEEVAQDALVRAYRAIGGYPAARTAELRLRPWLAAITVNLARNRRRRHEDRHPPAQLEPLMSDGFDRADEAAPSGPAAATRREGAAALASLLLELPPAVRIAVVLRHVDGLSVAETAAALGRPEGTVKAQVSRGLQRLRVLLATTSVDPVSGLSSRPHVSSSRTFAAAEVLA
jgi:RNA polymerase sigma-70 factor (ECF subfamily)